MLPSQTILKTALALSDTLAPFRRDLHQHPELGFEETRTAAQVRKALHKLGIPLTGAAKTGIVGVLRGRAPGKTVALRADLDALKIQEANAIPYRSRNQGIMHACGHDGHITMVLGAAMILKRFQAELKGNVKFIFQPAEESVEGAERMIAAGALERPRVDAIFGIHLWPNLRFGTVGIRPGPIMAAARHFKLTVVGKGGHGARPNRAVDPIVAANQIYTAFQTIRRTLDPFSPCVISVCAFNAGTTYNIIPPAAVLQGTLRTYAHASEAKAMRAMRAIVRGVTAMTGTRCRIDFHPGTPAVVNVEPLVQIVREAGRALKIPVAPEELSMGSEDFSCFQEKVPGAYLKLGTMRGKTIRELHSHTFDFDESILPLGAALLADCAVRALAKT